MAYSDFKLSELIKTFGLTLTEAVDLFADVEEVECSDNLAFNLKDLSNYPVVNANKILGILMNTIYNQVGGRN